MLTQVLLQEHLSYNPLTGEFHRLKSGRGKRVGDKAGTINGDGYCQISVCGKVYLAHQLAWLYVHGEWVKQLDHRNRKRADNPIANLRPSTQSQNLANASRLSANTSGFKGVHQISNGRWRASVYQNRKRFHLGYFDSAESAHQAYVTKAAELYGEFHFKG